MYSVSRLDILLQSTYLSTFDVMGILGISRNRAQALCRNVFSRAPYFAAFKLGKNWKIDPEGFARWNEDIHFGTLY